MNEDRIAAWRSPRAWGALAVLLVGLGLVVPFESVIDHAMVQTHIFYKGAPNTLELDSFATGMLIRLAWNTVLWIAVCLALGYSPKAFPMRDSKYLLRGLLGLVTGLLVMIVAILVIWAVGSASVASSGQTWAAGIEHGVGWLFVDFLGAFGEEVYGRAVILVVAERFFGWKGAVLVSGIVFSGLHIANPGASWIWLLRLFLQGALLAYAVFRTRSIWWGVGYHTGWNWASAPLFGAAGSGFTADGHLLDFSPTGSVWITGGAVGPEGSVFAFTAVLVAFGLLLVMNPAVSSGPRKRSNGPIVGLT